MFYEKELNQIKNQEKKLKEKILLLNNLHFEELKKQNIDFEKQIDDKKSAADKIKFCNQYKYALGFYELCDDTCPIILTNENPIEEAFELEIKDYSYVSLENQIIDPETDNLDEFFKSINNDGKNIFDYCSDKESYYNSFFKEKILFEIYQQKIRELEDQKAEILNNLTDAMEEINNSLSKAKTFLNKAKNELFPKKYINLKTFNNSNISMKDFNLLKKHFDDVIYKDKKEKWIFDDEEINVEYTFVINNKYTLGKVDGKFYRLKIQNKISYDVELLKALIDAIKKEIIIIGGK